MNPEQFDAMMKQLKRISSWVAFMGLCVLLSILLGACTVACGLGI